MARQNGRRAGQRDRHRAYFSRNQKPNYRRDFFIAVGSAAVLTAIDIYYVSQKVISKIYLLDAAVEMFLIACWLIF